MRIDEFIEYIKKLNIDLTEKDKIILRKYICAVREIEYYSSKLDGNIGPPYFKAIMLPDDYKSIEDNLVSIRQRMFYTIRREKIKYLRKLEYTEEEIQKGLINFEEKIAKKLKLHTYRDRYKNTKFKDDFNILTRV